MSAADPHSHPTHRHPLLAWLVLGSFLITFGIARLTVYLITTNQVPQLYLHVNGTHVHHLNYGIVLLAVVGAFTLLVRPAGKMLHFTGLLYGVGLGLTFDEFGMFLNLGGGYWQGVSCQAVAVIAVLLGIVAAGPHVKRIKPRHWAMTGAITVIIIGTSLVWRPTVRTLHRFVRATPKTPMVDHVAASDRR